MASFITIIRDFKKVGITVLVNMYPEFSTNMIISV